MLTISNCCALETDNRHATIEWGCEVPHWGHNLGKVGINEADFAIDKHPGSALD